MYNSFHGEIKGGKYVDEVLREYFPNYSYKGVFLDIGAYEPINISNSYHFEKNDWDVYCFEANTMLIDKLKKERKNVYNYAIYDESKSNIEFNVVKDGWGGGSGTAGISAIELSPQYLERFYNGGERIKINVEQKTMNDLLENVVRLKTNEIDIVSIDVEGGELKVLHGFDLNKYKVKVFCIENVFDDPRIAEYLKQYNYVLDKKIEYNEFYRIDNSLKFYGQHGEDKYLSQFFDNAYAGVCVDVGAHDGINISNTYYFEQNGWTCLCIEPIPDSFEKCKSIRKNAINCCVSDYDKDDVDFHIVTMFNSNQSSISSLKIDERLIESHTGMIANITDIKIKVKSLNTILNEAHFPKNIDFISIDTENTELDVLKGIDFDTYKINFLVIENNFNENMIENYLIDKNFTKIYRLAVNDFYVNNDYLNFKIDDCFDIIHANYYVNEDVSMGNVTNIFKILTKKYIQSNYKNDIVVTNELFGDTIFGHVKKLFITIENTINRHLFKFIIKENDLLDFEMIFTQLRHDRL